MGPVIQRKVCMLGSFSVGKTSLVQRYLRGTHVERPVSTVGVKIDRASIDVDYETVNLIIWDIHGDDEFQRIHTSYLRGARGHMLVADATRPATFGAIARLREMADDVSPGAAFVLVLNKSDAVAELGIPDDALRELEAGGLPVFRTSARSGEGVTDAFAALARAVKPR